MEAVELGIISAVLMSATVGCSLGAQQIISAQTSRVPAGSSYNNPNSLAPQDALEKRISIKLLDEPINRALETIAARAGERFTYSSDDLPSAKRVSLAQQELSVRTALQLVLAGTNLHAVVMRDGAVVLTTGAVHPAPSAPTTAGTLVLTGHVIDVDGSPVRDASVGLTGTRDTATASDSGDFRISGVVPGTYTLWARRIGFRAGSMTITVGAPPSFETITLVRAVAALPTVTTTETHQGYQEVGFEQRMRGGQGAFLTYEQIVAQHADRMTQMLHRLGGLTFGEPGLGYNGGEELDGQAPFGGRVRGDADGMWTAGTCVAVAVDGVAQGVLDTREIDNLIDPSDVGAIEVYNAAQRPGSAGPGTAADQIPLVLVGGRDLLPSHCTLVVIWTRLRLGFPSADERTAKAGTDEGAPAPPHTPR